MPNAFVNSAIEAGTLREVSYNKLPSKSWQRDCHGRGWSFYEPVPVKLPDALTIPSEGAVNRSNEQAEVVSLDSRRQQVALQQTEIAPVVEQSVQVS